MDPQATPYDIAAIPYSPFTPGPILWLTLFGCAVVAGILLFWISRRKVLSHFSPRAEAARMLRHSGDELSESTVRSYADQCSSIIRRVLAAEYSLSCESASLEEIQKLMGETSSPFARGLLESLTIIERHRYATNPSESEIRRGASYALKLLQEESVR